MTITEEDFAINEETGKKYKLNPGKYRQYPALAELKRKCETIPVGSVEYWKLRCEYLEKTIDPTYSVFERDNCRDFYKILANRHQ